MEAAGYGVKWIRREPAIYTAEVTGAAGATHLEWVLDSEFRLFPVMKDDTFGFVLHPVDLAANKAMAAAGRREVRDIVDLVTVHETILPLGAVIWAAVEKSPGYTPEGLTAEIMRNSIYPAAEWRSLATAEPFNPTAIIAKLRAALDGAEAFVGRMPSDLLGLLFLQSGELCSPIPTACPIIRRTPGEPAVTGRPAPRLPRRCWNVIAGSRTAATRSRRWKYDCRKRRHSPPSGRSN